MFTSLIFRNLAVTNRSLSQSRQFVSASPITENKFDERERAFENQHVRKREREALERLRKQLGLGDDDTDSQVARAVADVENAISSERQQDQVTVKADEVVSSDEFLAFRKEIMGKVRHLEDEVAELKYKLNKLKQL
mmetsp:Transcript_21405/g.31820  ORF Transcript_21405/g.31820 Transcript_21405/m.31820 type:complete len:137 (-) Transcript_21405:136-546(-)